MTETIARRRITTLNKLQIIVAQAVCPLCGLKLGSLDGLDFDHAVPLALGGADDLTNLRAVHHDCHKAKTFGRPATTAGSDIHAIARVKRLAARRTDFDLALLSKATGEAQHTDHKHKAKIPSRPFSKRIKA